MAFTRKDSPHPVVDNPLNETLLEEIRDNYDFDSDAWRDIRTEGSTDIKYLSGDPWSEKEKKNRTDNDRPLVVCDELNQYPNLIIGELRQHPREIKISPKGFGATDKLAEFREDRIRAIQYRSNAQDAYLTAGENMLQRSYGYYRVSVDWQDKSFEQEISINRMPDPDAVLYDAACKKLDCSDAGHCFVLDQVSRKEFRKRWPKANIQDFNGEAAINYPQWIQDKFVQVAEYWRVEKEPDTLVQFDGGPEGPMTNLLSELPPNSGIKDGMLVIPAYQSFPGIKAKVFNQRPDHKRRVRQYITNGLEILEEHDWLGKWIPIVPMFGKELYISDNGGSKRILMSLIRLARDPYMAYCYFKTCETEAVGMVPKTTYLAIEGQFEGHEEEVKNANKNPMPFVYYKGSMPDSALGQQLLPPPIREPFDPPLQNLEIGAEAMRRAIQSAVGMYNSSVGKHDTNAKSGKAIQELDEQSDQGSFHFIDNFNRGIAAGGRIVNDLLTKIERTEQKVARRGQDGKESMVRINTAQPYNDEETGESQHFPMDVGEFDVTISVGPNFDSQREQGADFLETFIETLPQLALDPQKRDQLLALSIKMRQLGPSGDAMAEILEPPEPGSPEELKVQMQQMQAQLSQLQQENSALHLERAGKVVEQNTKLQIENMRGQNQLDNTHMTNLVKIIIAELQSKSRSTDQIAEQDADRVKTELGLNHELMKTAHDAAHEQAMNAVNHSQTKELADQQHSQAKDLATQQGAQAMMQQEAPNRISPPNNNF